MDWVGAGGHGGYQGVPCFVIGGVALFFVGENHRLALDAHQDFVFRHFEVDHHYEFAVLACRPERGFVDEVG